MDMSHTRLSRSTSGFSEHRPLDSDSSGSIGITTRFGKYDRGGPVSVLRSSSAAARPEHRWTHLQSRRPGANRCGCVSGQKRRHRKSRASAPSMVTSGEIAQILAPVLSPAFSETFSPKAAAASASTPSGHSYRQAEIANGNLGCHARRTLFSQHLGDYLAQPVVDCTGPGCWVISATTTWPGSAPPWVSASGHEHVLVDSGIVRNHQRNTAFLDEAANHALRCARSSISS